MEYTIKITLRKIEKNGEDNSKDSKDTNKKQNKFVVSISFDNTMASAVTSLIDVTTNSIISLPLDATT